jgi:PBP1b-binding outer membrane lipoprotein LpoB
MEMKQTTLIITMVLLLVGCSNTKTSMAGNPKKKTILESTLPVDSVPSIDTLNVIPVPDSSVVVQDGVTVTNYVMDEIVIIASNKFYTLDPVIITANSKGDSHLN